MAGMLNDKVALITGGSSGIGEAIVSLFLEQGAKVAALDIRDASKSASETLLNIKCSVASEADIEAAVKQTIEKWGQIDILVNCAGVMDAFDLVGTVSNEIWERCLSINLTGPMQLIRCCIPELLKTKGAIVNICSLASVSGAAAGVAYTASKHALLGVGRQTAFAYAKQGIRCNTVLPGGVETNIMQNSATGMNMPGFDAIKAFHASMPATCKPADIANSVLFLATAPAVNGAELSVDQGWRAA